jgi:hypothetical protein
LAINLEPKWSFTANKNLYLWYGHVSLLDDYVVGQWFALNRKSGECLWQREFPRANSIFEISDGVILASETRSDGPWTADFGCYGISLTSGEMLWQWTGKGIRGRLVRWLEKIPGYTNEYRPHFLGVRENECATTQGDILNIHTGKYLRSESEISIPRKNYSPQSDAKRVYRGQPVEISEGLYLSTRKPLVNKNEKLSGGVTSSSSPRPKTPFGFILCNSQKQVIWDWSPEEMGLKPISNYYGWRLVAKKLLLLCGEEEATVPINPDKPLIVKSNPTKYRLLQVDALTGRVDQNLMVTKEKVTTCRLEDVGSAGFLVSQDNRHLQYYVF